MKEKECRKEGIGRWNHRVPLFYGDLLGFLTDNDLPAMNIRESKRAYKLYVSAPGFEKDDFKMRLEGDTLIIEGNDREEVVDQDDDEITLRQEFVDSSFSRSFTLPQDADTERIEARAKNGMLTIKIYKKENAPQDAARDIEIE